MLCMWKLTPFCKDACIYGAVGHMSSHQLETSTMAMQGKVHHRSLPGPSSKRHWAKGLGPAPGSQATVGGHQWYSHDAHGKLVFAYKKLSVNILPTIPVQKKTLAASYWNMETVRSSTTRDPHQPLRVPNHTSHATAQCLGRIGLMACAWEAHGNREAP